jgi:hypothetical protein
MLPLDFHPTDTDILCGRGKAYSNHPGNKMFSRFVKNSLQRYVDAPKRIDKSMVVASVVSQIMDVAGARFVKQDKSSGRWFQMNEDQAHEKTGHAIRDLIKSQSLASEKNDSNGSGIKKKGTRNNGSSKPGMAKKKLLAHTKNATYTRRSVCFEPINVLSEQFCQNAFETDVARNFSLNTSEILNTVLKAQEVLREVEQQDMLANTSAEPTFLLPMVSMESVTPPSEDELLDASEPIFSSADLFLEEPAQPCCTSVVSDDALPEGILSSSMMLPAEEQTPDANDFVKVFELLSSDDEDESFPSLLRSSSLENRRDQMLIAC